MPLMKKYIFPVAKELGRNLVSSFVPDSTSIVSGKKTPRKAVRDVLKKSETKTIMDATQEWVPRRTATRRAVTGWAAIGRTQRRRGRTPSHGPAKVRAAKKSNKVKSRNTVSGPSACRKVTLKKSRREKSVRHFVLSQFQLKPKYRTEMMATGISGTATTLFSRSSEIGNPVKHSALDSFVDPPRVLINYEGSFDQEVFPHVGWADPNCIFLPLQKTKTV